MSFARSTAFEVLRGVELRKGEPAGLLADPRYRSLASADRDLAMEIVFGVLRMRARLDWILEHHAKRALAELDFSIRLALRVGLYQILHLDRVPDRAAVDESVRLAAVYGAARGKGLVNAVLRSALRKPESPSLPRKEEDPLGYLSTTLSSPRWLAERYLRRLGADVAEARCLAQNRTPPLHLRVSARLNCEQARALLASENVETEILSEAPQGLRVVSGSPAASALGQDGLVFPQDAGSQLVPLLLEVGKAERVLDVCAAPGGKATALAELASDGTVVAVDRRPRRIRLLREIAAKLRAENVRLLVADGRKLPIKVLLAREPEYWVEQGGNYPVRTLFAALEDPDFRDSSAFTLVALDDAGMLQKLGADAAGLDEIRAWADEFVAMPWFVELVGQLGPWARGEPINQQTPGTVASIVPPAAQG